jgi:hypothetical protein
MADGAYMMTWDKTTSSWIKVVANNNGELVISNTGTFTVQVDGSALTSLVLDLLKLIWLEDMQLAMDQIPMQQMLEMLELC